MAGLLIILGFIVLAGWLFTVLSPETRSPEFIKMTTSQQQEFLKQKSFEMAKAPVVVYTHIAMNIVAVVGFICALAALVKKAGKKFAVPGLIITGIFLGMQLLKFLPKK
jgi:flagellar biogenesis protein FliO